MCNLTNREVKSDFKDLDGILEARIISKALLQSVFLDEIISPFNPWLCILHIFTSINSVKSMYRGITVAGGITKTKRSTILCKC